ncbi:MAG TPA: hypothetical protein VMM76_26265, partial [Pirellulaceae bacterium]|nr:hypothetical protein [Pirellulaceae bacterium]
LIVDFTPGRPHVVPGQGKRRGQKGLPRSRWIKQLGINDQIVEWFKPGIQRLLHRVQSGAMTRRCGR